ncbi:MAG TPA: hypothetical protein VF398_12290 [bacterium]
MVDRSFLKMAALMGALLLSYGGASAASQLLSMHSSYHPKENFAILVLRFDARTPHQYVDLQNGPAGLITLKNCSIEKDVATALKSVKNDLIQKTEIAKRASDLTISLHFSRAVKIKLRETQNPYSLILHISPAVNPKAAPKKSPTDRKKSTSAKERNRLAEADTSLESESLSDADLARQLAVLFDQMGDSAAEAQQWEAFFRTLWGEDSLLTAAPSAQPESLVHETIRVPSSREAASQEVLPMPPRERKRFPFEMLLSGLIVIIGAVTVVLYLKQREMNRAIKALLDDHSHGESSGPPKASPRLERTSPLKSDPLGEAGRPSDDTAREVLALYRTGMAIPAIAEKMQMGQDEIRLILNLAREEKTTVS